MKALALFAVAAAFALLSTCSAVAGASQYPLSLTVYQDGYVHISQTVQVDPKATSVEIPLLSPQISDLLATDQDGSPLSYQFAANGDNLTVYTLGASSATLTYDTSSLTYKNGTVWTIDFASRYNCTLALPALSTLSATSGTPYSINESGNSPELALSPGSWTVSYGVPFEGVTSSTTGSGTSNPTQGASGGSLELEAGGLAVVALAAAVFVVWRRRRPYPTGELRPDDVRVLDFIREKGGKVLEPEIRMKFALPKTSAWRQIKRLERMGYVRVTKIGSQNQIELSRERDAG